MKTPIYIPIFSWPATRVSLSLAILAAFAPLNAMEQVPAALSFVCQTCDKDFTYESILHAHKQNHTGATIKPYTCHYPDCGYACRRSIDLVSHEKRTHPDSNTTKNCRPCTFPGCRCICLGEQTLTRHIHHDHTSSNAIPAAALTTQETPQEQSTVIATPPAEKQAAQPAVETTTLCVCKHCGNSFTYSNTLAAHEKNHTDGKPYFCTYPDCGYATNTPGSLDTHTQTHPNKNRKKIRHCPFAGCRCSYISTNSLGRHTNRDHANIYNRYTKQTRPVPHGLEALQERTRKRETPALTGAMPPIVPALEPTRGESPYLHTHSSLQNMCEYEPENVTNESKNAALIVEPQDALSSPEDFGDIAKLDIPHEPWDTHEAWF